MTPTSCVTGMDRVGLRGSEATAKGGQAYARLVNLAETRDSGQIRSVVRFIASTYNGQAFPFDLFDLRGLDEAIGDDMLLCLDALRWGRIDLYRLIPDGDKRVHCPVGPQVARRGLMNHGVLPRGTSPGGNRGTRGAGS